MDLDLFHVFRRALALVCGVYAVLQSARALVYWWESTAVAGARGRFLRRYVLTHLLRAKLGPFGVDLLHIALLLAGLAWLLLIHEGQIMPP